MFPFPLGLNALLMNYYHISKVIYSPELLEENDEVLIALATAIPKLLNTVPPASTPQLAAFLVSMCIAPENTIRDKATSAICTIITSTQSKGREQQFKDMLSKLIIEEPLSKLSFIELSRKLYECKCSQYN